MNFSDLTYELDHYFGTKYKAICIDGVWGIGKTYFIKKYVEENNMLYISLFGITSSEELKREIYYALNKKHKKLKKLFSHLPIFTYRRNNVEITFPQINDKLNEISKRKKGRNITIIIDDLERKNDNLKIVDVFGIIDKLISSKNIKFILVCDSSKLSQTNEYGNEKSEYDYFKEYKEKIIEKTYEIADYSNNALVTLSKRLGSLSNVFVKIYSKNYNNYKNLRNINKIIIFTEVLFDELKNHNLSYSMKEKIIEYCIIAVLSVEENYIMNERLYNEYTKFNEKSYEDKIVITNGKKELKNVDNFYEELLFDHKVSLDDYNNNRIDNIIVYKIDMFFYFKEESHDIFDIIYNIVNFYLVVNKEKYEIVNLAEKIINSINLNTNDEKEIKDLFYFSEKELQNKAIEFKRESLDNRNEKIDLEEFIIRLNKLCNIFQEYELKFPFDKDDVLAAIPMYFSSDNIGYVKCITIYKYSKFYEDIQNDIELLYYEYLLNKYINVLSELFSLKKYNDEILEKIFSIINNISQLKEKGKDLLKKVLVTLKEINYFVPEIDGSIDEESWSFTHKIFKYENYIFDQNVKNTIKKDLYNILKNKSKKMTSVGKKRCEYLIDTYKLDQNT